MNIENKNSSKKDRRCRKTEKAIKLSFMILMLENDIEKITIKQITDKADISRKTFYLHFYDIYDVLETIENEIIEKLYLLLNQFDLQVIKTNPYIFLKAITDELNEDISFRKFLLSSTTSSKLLNKLKILFKNELIKIYEEDTKKNPDKLSYALTFITSGVIDTYQQWFNSDRTDNLEDLSKELSLLITEGITSVL